MCKLLSDDGSAERPPVSGLVYLLNRLLWLRRRLGTARRRLGTAVGGGRAEWDRAAGAEQLPDRGECRGGSGKAHAGKAPAAGREAGGDEGPQQRRQLVGETGAQTSGVSETVRRKGQSRAQLTVDRAQTEQGNPGIEGALRT